MSEQVEISPGADVLVAWGLDEVAGRVVSVKELPGRLYVDVSVEFPDSDEAEVVTVPSEAIRPLKSHEREVHSITGRWLDSYHYQEELGRALDRVLSGSSALDAVQHVGRASRDTGVDFVASLEDGTMLVVEAKKFSSPTSRNVRDAVDQLAHFLGRMTNAEGPRVRGLVVFGTSADRSGETERTSAPKIAISYWQGPDDDDALRSSLTELLA